MNVELESVCKSYGEELVLDSIDLSIEEGNIVALLGRNGAGKTTLINCIMDIVAPDSGSITIDGSAMEEEGDRLKVDIGIMSEDNPLVTEFNGRTYLEWSARLYGLSTDVARERYESMMDLLFEDDEALDKPISSYSTGMKKKIAYTACLLHNPTLLILDEPFSGLDPIAANQMVKLLKEYASPNRSIFIASHDLTYVQKLATHILVLDEHEIKFRGSIEEFTSEGKEQLDDVLIEILSPSEFNLETVNWIKEQ